MIGSVLPVIYCLTIMRAAALVSVLCSSIFFLDACSPKPTYHFEEVYGGKLPRPISFDRPIACNAESKVHAGYDQRDWIRDRNVFSYIDVSMQAVPTLWKIIVHGQTADVTVGGGDYRTIEAEVWDVASKTENVLVLLRKDPGIGISTVTIDAKSGTFIHCFSGCILDANTATIYWGTCSD